MGGVNSLLPSGVVRIDTVRGEIGDALGETLGEEEHLLFFFPLVVVGGLLGDRELDLLLLVSGVGYTGCQDEKGVLGEGGAYSGDRMITDSSSSVGGLIRMMEPTAEESRS